MGMKSYLTVGKLGVAEMGICIIGVGKLDLFSLLNDMTSIQSMRQANICQ